MPASASYGTTAAWTAASCASSAPCGGYRSRGKKSLTCSEQQDPKVQRQRAAWRRRVAGVDAQRLKFLDQTNAKTTLTRLYGRAPRGQRVREYVPDGRWESLTLMGTLGFAGDTTAFLYAGGTDVMAMLAFVEEILGPQLRPGDIVVMDRLSSHLDPGVVAAVEATGAEAWHLPPYSHDLNPIEQMWSKIKAYLRKVKPRDMEGLISAIADALRTVSAQDAANWFAHCGYTNTLS
jgi:transposase